MKGFVPTPPETVDLMLDRLFRDRPPRPQDVILDPGCGTGAFIQGLICWCARKGCALPRVVGVESDPGRAAASREKFRRHGEIKIRQDDFLLTSPGSYDFIVGNPPYVPITGLSEEEKTRYRARYSTAHGRFDLYLLFFEQALRSLKRGGRLVFVTPEKFLYVETAAPLRRLFSQRRVEEIRLVDEQTFGSLTTYPTITTVANVPPCGATSFVPRDGESIEVTLPDGGGSWLPSLNREQARPRQLTLRDICVRVSCGVATGSDSVFVRKTEDLDSALSRFAYPTIAGRELGSTNSGLDSRYSMLIPYTKEGELLDEGSLGPLRSYLVQRSVRAQLMARTCVKRKPWYAFHETPPLAEILRPKILCKDITAEPRFWIDRTGRLVPRHSTYYIVPKAPQRVEEICAFLNSRATREWLESHCQRAANGFLRVQSRILKELPIPPKLAEPVEVSRQRRLFDAEAIPRSTTTGSSRLEPETPASMR